MKYVRRGWSKSNQKDNLLQLYERRDNLPVITSCQMFADRAVIPSALKRAVLQQFRNSHLDVSRMKFLTGTFANWPETVKDVEAVVQRCSKCQQAVKLPSH